MGGRDIFRYKKWTPGFIYHGGPFFISHLQYPMKDAGVNVCEAIAAPNDYFNLYK